MLLKKKPRFGIALVIVFSMVLQLSGPLVELVYANNQSTSDSFQVDQVAVENGEANIDWSLVTDETEGEKRFNHQFDFELETEIVSAELKLNDGSVVGSYSVSQNGKMEVIFANQVNQLPEVVTESKEESGLAEPLQITSSTIPIEDESEDSEEGKDNTDGITSEKSPDPNPDQSESADREQTSKTKFSGSLIIPGVLLNEGTESLKPLSSDGSDLGDIFTEVKIKLNNVEITDETIIEVADNMELKVEFDWALPNEVPLNSGDYSIISLPSGINLQRDEEGDLLDEKSDAVGKYYLTKSDGLLKVVFNDKLVNKIDRSGKVWVVFDFDLSKFEENTTQIITFGTEPEKSFKIKIKPNNGSLINKFGEADKGLNANSITWAVDLNTKLDKIKNAKITDAIPEGLELEKIEIYNLSVGYNGKLTLGSKFREESAFPIELDDIDSAYRIIYKTFIKDKTKSSFTNVVRLVGDDVDNESDITVNTPRGSLINKFDGEPNKELNPEYIKWIIQVNVALDTINEAKVIDNLPEGLSLKEGSLKIYNLLVEGSGQTTRDGEATGALFDYYNNTREISVSLGNINSAYEIEFETTINYSTNIIDYGKTFVFSNTAYIRGVIEGSEEDLGQDSSEATVKRGEILTKAGSKNITPTSKKINWTITLNEAEENLKDVWVEDNSGEGIEFIPGTIIVKNSNGTKLKLDIDYEIRIPGDKLDGDIDAADFKVVFLKEMTSKHTVQYSTKITDFNKTKFTNAARISWIPKYIGGGDGSGSGEIPVRIYKNIVKTIEAKVADSYSKKYKSIDYKNKTINWEVNLNFLKGETSVLQLYDTFPNNGLVFMEDSLTIIMNNGVEETLVKDTDYTVSTPSGSYGKDFKIIFLRNFEDSTLKITYKTSFNPNQTELIPLSPEDANEYKNKVHITGKNIYKRKTTDINTNRYAEHKFRIETYKNGIKLGSIDRENREISWKIYVNYLGKNLKNNPFVITDTLSGGQQFDATTLSVKPYTLDKTGNYTIVENPIDSSTYTVTSVGSGFELRFPDGINEPYVVEFKSKILGVSLNKYTNKAIVTGSKDLTAEVTYENHDEFIFKKATNVESKVWIEDQIDWNIKINESLSDIVAGAVLKDNIDKGLVYLNGSLKVLKQDGTPLESSKYDFNEPTADKNNGLGTQLTVTFKENISEIYTIEYSTIVVTKTGSIKNNASFNGESIVGNTNSGVEISVGQSSGGTGTGKDKKGAIIIYKIDENEMLITAEAEFEVYYLLGEQKILVEGTTHKTINGKILIEDLNFRNYYIKEVKAPYGFSIDEEENVIEVDVKKEAGNNLTGAYEFVIENKHIKTDITGKKVWENGPETRPTIQLQLFRDGEPTDAEIATLVNGITEYKWGNLDLTDNAGRKYIYTVDEVEVPKNYEKKESENRLEIINSYVIPKTDVTGYKVWLGGPSVKPTIELQLYQNGKPYEGPVTFENDKLKHIWKDLDETDINGVPHQYTIQEVETPRNYRKVERGLTVTNLYDDPNAYVSPKIDIKGTKVWIGGPEEKPAVKFQLFRDDKAFGEPVTLENGVTEYVWKDIDKTDIIGIDYVYTVKEVDTPENYQKVENGLMVTNTYVSPKIDVQGTKVWVGGPEVKPTIQLQLSRNGINLGEPVTLVNGMTEYTWIDLDLTDGNGLKYVYTIDEVNVPSTYVKTISDDGMTITNTNLESTRGQLIISKVDFISGEALEGAIFRLTNEDGTIVIDTLPTDLNGKITVGDLMIGKYSVVEVVAPLGYELDSETIYEFEIEDNNLEANLTIVNRRNLPNTGGQPSLPDTGGKPSNPTPSKPTLPATGTSSSIPFYLLGISLVALGSVALLRKRKLNN